MSKANVYIGNISSQTRSRDLQGILDKYGPIKRFDLKAGFAFVDYEDSRDAEDCISKMDGYEMDGRKLTVEKARDPAEKRRGGPRGNEGTGIRGGAVRGPRENCIVVEGMGSRTAWTDLKDWAREAGPVEYTDVWYDGRKKLGVVKFQSREAFKRAVKDLDDTKLDGNYVRVFEDDYRRSRSHSRSKRRSSRSRDRKKEKRSRSRSRSREEKKKDDKANGEHREGERDRDDKDGGKDGHKEGRKKSEPREGGGGGGGGGGAGAGGGEARRKSSRSRSPRSRSK